MGAATARRWPLVGRGAELGVVADALGQADVSAVVLVGEVGVGKSRLGTECLTIAEKAGFATARVLASRAAQTIPLGALAGVVPVEAQELDAGAVSLQRIRAAIAELGDHDPLMILVDDAHLLDAASATVLQQLVVNGDAFVVATIRVDGSAHDAVATLWRDDAVVRIEVGPLGRHDVENLVEQALDGAVEGPTLAELYRLSEGNPLYVRELVEGALEAAMLERADGVWRFSVRDVTRQAPRLVELVEARLVDLTEDQREALEIVALGEPVPLTMFEQLTGSRAPQELERRGLIRVDLDGRRAQVRLTHPLHGDVLRKQIEPLRSMALQGRLVEALGREPAMRSDDVLRLAVWGLESRTRVPVDALFEAARRAHFAYDDALAERLARVAFEEGGDAGSGQLLGEILWMNGRYEDAERVLETVAKVATTDEHVAFVAMTLASVQFWNRGDVDAARATLDDALERLAGSRELEGEMRAQRATYDLLGGRPAVALAEVQPILTAGGAGRAAVEAAIAGAPALAVMGRFDEAIEVADRALATHLDLGDLELMSHPGIHLVARALALGEAGRLEEAIGIARMGYEGAIAEGVAEGQAWFALMLGRSLWLRRPGEAARWFVEASNVYAGLHEDGPRRWCLAGAALCTSFLGDSRRASELLDEISTLSVGHFGLMESDFVRARGWARVAAGDAAGGSGEMFAAAAVAHDAGVLPLEAAALHDLVRLERPDDVAGRLSEIAATVDAPLVTARARHAVALADADALAVETAAEAFASMGVDVLAAEAFAQVAGHWSRSSDPRRARQASRRALSLGREAGGLDTPAMHLIGDAARLTPRELEIAGLAAGGRSNADIAEGLVLSVRTVANHLQRTYEKLGIRHREELAGALRDVGDASARSAESPHRA